MYVHSQSYVQLDGLLVLLRVLLQLISNWLGILREYYESIVKTGAPPQPLQVKEAPTPEGEPQRYFVKVIIYILSIN